jgi:hypothetical protein
VTVKGGVAVTCHRSEAQTLEGHVRECSQPSNPGNRRQGEKRAGFLVSQKPKGARTRETYDGNYTRVILKAITLSEGTKKARLP